MDGENLDRIVAEEDELIPSSGFVAAVMERVETEAVAPPPIPFPWKRALPGMVLAAAVLVWAAVEMARAVRTAGGLALPQMHLSDVTTPAFSRLDGWRWRCCWRGLDGSWRGGSALEGQRLAVSS